MICRSFLLKKDFFFDQTNQVTFRTVDNDAYQFAPVAREETYTANGLNQYTEMVKDQVLRNFTYDANGNLTSDGVWVYTFDVENRLVNATDGATNVTYVYDPLGRRVKKSGIGTTETYYLSDGTEEVMELNANGDIQKRYVFGPGVDEPVLMYAGSGIADGAKRYYRADPQGSIIALTDYQGNVVDTYTYDAYGMPDDPGGQPIRYTGRRFDAETGLYYYRARMLSPAIGRFLQTDPVGYGDNTNLYGYVGNDPVNNKDPNGLDTLTVQGSSSAVVEDSYFGDGFVVGGGFYVSTEPFDVGVFVYYPEDTRGVGGSIGGGLRWFPDQSSDVLEGNFTSMEVNFPRGSAELIANEAMGEITGGGGDLGLGLGATVCQCEGKRVGIRDYYNAIHEGIMNWIRKQTGAPDSFGSLNSFSSTNNSRFDNNLNSNGKEIRFGDKKNIFPEPGRGDSNNSGFDFNRTSGICSRTNGNASDEC